MKGPKVPLRLSSEHMMAMWFLKQHPGDEVGVVDTEEQLAAAIIFSELIGAGYVRGTLVPGAGGCRLTELGEFVVADAGRVQ